LAAGGGLKIEGVAGGVAVPISGALTANQSINLAQVAGTNTVTGGVAGILAVGGNVANAVAATANPVPVGGIFTTTPATLTTGQTATAQYTAAQNLKTDLSTVAGTATVTGGLAGTQGVGGTTANNAAIVQNPVLIGVETLSQGTQPAAATTGNQRRALGSLEGVQYVQEGNSNRFSCFVQAVTVTTQCQAAPGAGLRAYVTSVTLSNQAATVQTLDVIYGTGANCATGPVALTHKWQFGTLATTTNPFAVFHSFTTPLIPAAANAICVRPSAATVFGATITGFIAP
jgi:hypothetical protein